MRELWKDYVATARHSLCSLTTNKAEEVILENKGEDLCNWENYWILPATLPTTDII